MQVYRNRHGNVQWTLRKNPETGQSEWVRPGTNEVDSRPSAWQFEPGDRPLVNAGARPTRASLKPSESLLRSLRSKQHEAEVRSRADRRKRLEELDRGIEEGRVIVHPEARTGGDNVVIPREGGGVVVLPREAASARDLAAAERVRAEREARAAEANRRAQAESEAEQADEFKRAVASIPREQVAEAQNQAQAPPTAMQRPVAISEGHDPSLPKPEPPKRSLVPENYMGWLMDSRGRIQKGI